MKRSVRPRTLFATPTPTPTRLTAPSLRHHSKDMSPEERRAAEVNKRIDQALAKAARAERLKVKLLLLGAGESGKSTIFKQFQILYGNGFSDEERLDMKDSIHNMILTAVKTLVDQSEEFGYAAQWSDAEKKSAEAIKSLHDASLIGPDEAANMETLWNSKPVQDCWVRRSEFQVIEANGEYLKDISRIGSPKYVPTIEDILYLRVRTTGIIENALTIENVPFLIVDVGGQRNERKKWIHCFEDVSAVIFVAAISEYDQVLFEDYSQNRMVEALTLFEEICDTSYFMHKPMILFLNKSDLFKIKLQKVEIGSVEEFSDYTGEAGNFDDGVEYFVEKFHDKNYQPNRYVYHHVTCATNTDNVRFVFDSCRDIILGDALAESGLSG
uniref:Uncharacterized protein n=1 Tax=Pinguiococcus pyrenoidosus TaxID=172671 RepID=A0A7R9UBY7_9STRA|mmetsp:Transcript_3951/g.15233  ORF Transcript_3951/g.15233 Transcript_3951/m.15233 type:complete len:384 (+) Transcript_3951:212-1363(+)